MLSDQGIFCVAINPIIEDTIMARLRDPLAGCPWDKEQTPQSLKKYIVEEAYEVIEAVDAGSPDKLREELGDLLLQVVFQAQIAHDDAPLSLYRSKSWKAVESRMPRTSREPLHTIIFSGNMGNDGNGCGLLDRHAYKAKMAERPCQHDIHAILSSCSRTGR